MFIHSPTADSHSQRAGPLALPLLSLPRSRLPLPRSPIWSKFRRGRGSGIVDTRVSTWMGGEQLSLPKGGLTGSTRQDTRSNENIYGTLSLQFKHMVHVLGTLRQ